MKQNYFYKLKTSMMLLAAAGVLYSCSLETVSDDLAEQDSEITQILNEADLLNAQMRLASTGSCEVDCIEPGSEIFYPASDMATLSVGRNTKSVSYTAYNTETDFVVEATYTITASKAKATLTIEIEGNEVEFTGVSSGSTVSHTVPLAEDWAGCDQVSFSVVQEGLGTPITFSESYSLIPVCPEVSLEIGMEYQGGIIAYILQPGDPGYLSGETHGIIAAPSDHSERMVWWNGSLIPTGATGTALGTGQANTTAIVTSQGAGSYAAQVCNDLVLGGYDDWYLPSRDELIKLNESKLAVGGFESPVYWSSSEVDTNTAYITSFTGNSGYSTDYGKQYITYVRAVRSF